MEAWDISRLRFPGVLDLSATLDSGQAFRWYPQGGGYLGIINDWLVLLEPGSEGICVSGLAPNGFSGQSGEREFVLGVSRYLDLDRDYGEVARLLAEKDDLVGRMAAEMPGLRLLRQEPWETLGSFALSSHNNIPRIKRMVHEIASRYGGLVERNGTRYHLFPSPERIARLTEDELRRCGLGFRAPYLLGIARAVDGGELDIGELRRLPLEDAKRRLMRLPGVGEKISECVLLFGFGKSDAFPIDVWIKRVMEELYFAGREQPYTVLREFARKRFGDMAGFAQNWLYHRARSRDRKES